MAVSSGASGAIAWTLVIDSVVSGRCITDCSTSDAGLGRSTVRRSEPHFTHSSSPSRFFAPQAGQNMDMAGILTTCPVGRNDELGTLTSHVQVLHLERVVLDELSALLDVLAHED